MKSTNLHCGLITGSILCLLLIFSFGAGCAKEDKIGLPSAATTDSGDLQSPPASTSQDSPEVAIAKCLSAKGVVFYGAKWCKYTQLQIASFKDGFQYLHYVECTEQAALCEANGVASYPTWIFESGNRIRGYTDPAQLGFAASCNL